MNETIELLRDVARNARTGEDAVSHLMNKAESAEMRGELDRERGQYVSAAQEAERALSRVGAKAEPISPLSKAGMWIGTEMETLTDRTNAHIAEIVIQGATMGVIEMTKARNTYADADSVATGLASRFIVDQNDIIERQKAYLSDTAMK